MLAATLDRILTLTGLVCIQWLWKNQIRFAKAAAALDFIWSSFIY